MQLPKRYIDDIRQVPGVSAATWANWFGAKDPKQRAPFFAGLAADHETWFDVMDEMKIDPAALEKWKQTANGAILGDVLARTLQVKVGDTLTINSDIYPGDWQFEVVGIYTPLRKTADRNTLLFRWDYLNNDPRGAWSKDQIGWIMTRIEDPKQSAAISKRIDATFDERDDQTLSMSERQFQLSWLGAFGAILTAFDYISIFIGLILLLIVANAIAMSVRERTHEYGVLRAIGFSPGYVGGFILAESVLIGIVGGLVGLLITFLLVNVLIGPLIEQGEMGAFFPYFSVPPKVFLQSLGFAFVIGLLAAVIPALGASRRRVTDALRRLD
jgi:putative ABC transport system permease protein